MKVLVGVKRVVDYAVKIRILPDRSGIDLSTSKMSMNPFCEIAVEQAIRLKEQNIISEIIAFSIGPKGCQDTLRTAMAMGVDKAIHLHSDIRTDQNLQPLTVAQIFKRIVEIHRINLVILGKQSIDGDNAQTGPMLAGLLGWAQGVFASGMEISLDKSGMMLDRETDRGGERLWVPFPAVLTTDLRLNEPRYATLPNIMKAKKRIIDSVSLVDLGLDDTVLTCRNVVECVQQPLPRKNGIILKSVDELLGRLKTDGLLSLSR